VLTATNRSRWFGHADAALAELASLRGDRKLAVSLFESARDHYQASHDTLGLAAVERQLDLLAKAAQRPRKGAPVRTSATRPKKGRTT
jgi:hypothetical protein